MNQNNTYAMDFFIPRYRFHLTSREGSKEETYTEKEQRLFKILSQTNCKGQFAVYIRSSLQHADKKDFREVVRNLKQQYQDCGRERMIEVLGVDAVKLIEVL
jgi:hypothetical protein